jgi:hypothetical protein
MGTADKLTGFAEQCMAEYDIDGWKVPDLTDPGELSYHVLRNGDGRPSMSRPQAPSAAPASAPPPPRAAKPAADGSVKKSSVGGFANPFASNKK